MSDLDSLILASRVVIPLLVYMAVGVLVRRCGILDEATLKKLNSFIFRVPLPLSLFMDIWQADLRAAVQPKLLLVATGLVLAVFLLAWFLIPRFVPDPRESTTMVQATFRSNYVLFGSTIGTALCGQEGAAIAASLAVVIVPLYNILSVILFESLRGGKVDPSGLLSRIFRNPLVDAGILGAVMNLLHIPLPDLLVSPLSALADCATPLALVVLGGLLSLRSMSSHRGYLLWAVFLRLVAVPAGALAVLVALGWRGTELVVLMAIFASPTAVASTPMAQSMGGDGILAGEIVAVSSAASILSLFGFITAFSALGFL